MTNTLLDFFLQVISSARFAGLNDLSSRTDNATASQTTPTTEKSQIEATLVTRNYASHVSSPWRNFSDPANDTSIGGYSDQLARLRYKFVVPGEGVSEIESEFLRQNVGENMSEILAYLFPPSMEDAKISCFVHGIVMPILLLIGFIFQCLNILTLNKLQAAGYLYLKASASADVVTIIIIVPFVLLHVDQYDPFSYSKMFYHAHIELPLINALIALSTLCLTMITINRFLSIFCALKCFMCRAPSAKTRIKLFMVLFILVVLLFVPSAWQRTLVPFVERDVRRPHERRIFWQIGRNFRLRNSFLFSNYVVLRELLTRILPMLLILILNIFITKKLRNMSNRRNSRCVVRTDVERERDHDRLRLGWLLVITSAIFVTCNLPACILSFYYHYTGYNTVEMQIFRAIANCIQFSHFMHYLYLYVICSSKYRRAFYVVLNELFSFAKQRSAVSAVPTSLNTTENGVRSRLLRIFDQFRQSN